jgi:hypothetical protein
MGNGEQSGSGDRIGWPIRLAAAVGGGIGAALGLLVKSLNLADLGFPLGMLVFVGMVGVGTILGRLAGSLLFRKPPSR